MFADLPSHFLLEPACVDKGEYIDHGTFGDIYHGSVYPSVTATVSTGVIVFFSYLYVFCQSCYNNICMPRKLSKGYVVVTAFNIYSSIHFLRYWTDKAISIVRVLCTLTPCGCKLVHVLEYL